MAESKLSPERRVAIGFVKVLRNYFEEYINPDLADNVDDSQIHVEMTGSGVQPPEMPEEVIEAIHEIFREMATDMSKRLRPAYEAGLVRVIGDALNELEVTLREKFTPEELTELSEIIEKDSVKKLLGCFDFIDNLRKHCDALYVDLQKNFRDLCESSDINGRIASLMSDMMQKHGIDAQFSVTNEFFGNFSNEEDDEDEDNEEETFDPNDDDGATPDPPED